MGGLTGDILAMQQHCTGLPRKHIEDVLSQQAVCSVIVVRKVLQLLMVHGIYC